MSLKGTSFPPISSTYTYDPHIIANAITAGLSVIDRKMRIIWVNKILEYWFGPLSKIKGRHCYEVYQKRAKVCPNCPTKKIFKTGSSHYTSIQKGILAEDGSKRYFRLTASPIRDEKGRIVQVLELVQDVTNHTKLHREAARRMGCAMKELASMSKLDKQFTSLKDVSLDKVLHQCVGVVQTLLNSKVCSLRLVDGSQKILVTRASSGLAGNHKKEMVIKVGEGVAGRAIAGKHPLIIKDLQNCKYAKSYEYAKRQDLHSALCVPIILKDEALGTLSVYDKKVGAFTGDDCRLLSCFANHVAILIDNIRAHKEVHISYINTIKSLVSTIEARDPYTRGHSEKVTKFALSIADAINLPKNDKLMLTYCGRLHDIGKIAISDTILNKPGPLTIAERAEVQLHPLKAVEMLTNLRFMDSGILAIRHHHERYDGQGYPDRLKGRGIPLLARILSCADAFDAMISERAYRPRMSTNDAILELRANRGKQFDPGILDVFLKIIKMENSQKV